MSIMMSDSLKDIISIGQLTGDDCVLVLKVDESDLELDVYSFIRHVDHTVVRCFARREVVAQCLSASTATADLSFSGKQVCKGELASVGFEVASFGDESHDGIVLHIKHDI
jgi:hypothetical protein